MTDAHKFSGWVCLQDEISPGVHSSSYRIAHFPPERGKTPTEQAWERSRAIQVVRLIIEGYSLDLNEIIGPDFSIPNEPVDGSGDAAR